MTGGPQTAFDHEFREHIQRFAEPLASSLRKITSSQVPPSVKLLLFEIQSDWREFPVFLFAMSDVSPDEVYFDPPFYGEILPNSGDLIPRSSEDEWAIDQDGYEEAGIDIFASGARVLAEWLGECWHTAGGTDFPFRCTPTTTIGQATTICVDCDGWLNRRSGLSLAFSKVGRR